MKVFPILIFISAGFSCSRGVDFLEAEQALAMPGRCGLPRTRPGEAYFLFASCRKLPVPGRWSLTPRERERQHDGDGRAEGWAFCEKKKKKNLNSDRDRLACVFPPLKGKAHF